MKRQPVTAPGSNYGIARGFGCQSGRVLHNKLSQVDICLLDVPLEKDACRDGLVGVSSIDNGGAC
jgi:hypothetical protein